VFALSITRCNSASASSRNLPSCLGMSGRGVLDAAFLQSFWDLANIQDAERQKAALSICRGISSGSSGEQKQKLDYALKRFVRGLCSSRECARQGFALAMTEVLAQHGELSLAAVLELMGNELKITGGMKGQEERDAHFGRVFGCMALVRSGRMVPIAAGGDDASHRGAAVRAVAAMLLETAEKKSFCSEIAAELLLQLARGLSLAQFDELLLPQLLPMLSQPDLAADWLSLAVALRKHFGLTQAERGTQCALWNASSPLADSNLSLMENGLATSTIAHPRVHSLWKCLVLELQDDSGGVAAGEGGGEGEARPLNSARLRALWATVEATLLPSSTERKFLAFQLFEQLLPLISPEQVRIVVTAGFKRVLLNNLKDRGNHLHSAAKSTLQAMQRMTKAASQEMRVAVLTQIMAIEPNFDAIARVKYLSSLVNSLDQAGIGAYVGYLRGFFESASIEGSNTERSQVWALDHIYSMARQPKFLDGEEGDGQRCSILLFLAAYGFMRPEGSGKDATLAASAGVDVLVSVSDKVRKTAAIRFYSLLHDFSSRTGDHTGADFEGIASDGRFWAERACDFVDSVLGSAKSGVALLVELGEDAVGANKQAAALDKRINKQLKKTPGDHHLLAFKYLGFQLRLQMLQEDAQEAVTENLLELVDCHEHLQLDSAKAPKGGGEGMAKGKPAESSAEGISVLVDMMLGMLSRDSLLLRDVVKAVFKAFCSRMTIESLGLLVDVLSNNHTVSVEGEDDDDDDEKSDDFSSSEDEGEENAKKPASAAEKSRADEAAAVAVESAMAQSDGDDNDSSDDNMDDDEMVKSGFDDKISAILRMRKSAASTKKSKIEEQRQLSHFKLRVLDLIEVFVKKEGSSPLVLQLVQPLVEVVGNTSSWNEQAVNERTVSVLGKLCHSKELPSSGEPALQALGDVLEFLAKRPAPSKLSAMAVVYVLRVLKADEGTFEQLRPKVAACLTQALGSTMSRKNCKLIPSFYCDLIMRHPWVGFELLEALLQHSSSACSEFLRFEVFTIVGRIAEQKASEAEKARLVPLLPRLEQIFAAVITEELKTDRQKLVLKCAMQTIAALDRQQVQLSGSRWETLKNSCSTLAASKTMKEIEVFVKEVPTMQEVALVTPGVVGLAQRVAITLINPPKEPKKKGGKKGGAAKAKRPQADSAGRAKAKKAKGGAKAKVER